MTDTTTKKKKEKDESKKKPPQMRYYSPEEVENMSRKRLQQLCKKSDSTYQSKPEE